MGLLIVGGGGQEVCELVAEVLQLLFLLGAE